MGVNSYFFPIRKNRQHATPNYVPGKSNFEVDYYIQTFFLQKKQLISGKTGKSGQKSMYSYKCFNSICMYFVGYEKYNKLIWISVEGCINTNIISKQGIPKFYLNMTFP